MHAAVIKIERREGRERMTVDQPALVTGLNDMVIRQVERKLGGTAIGIRLDPDAMLVLTTAITYQGKPDRVIRPKQTMTLAGVRGAAEAHHCRGSGGDPQRHTDGPRRWAAGRSPAGRRIGVGVPGDQHSFPGRASAPGAPTPL